MQSPLQDLAYDITMNRAEEHVGERISVMPSGRLKVEQVYCKTVFLPQMSPEQQHTIFPIHTIKGSVSLPQTMYSTKFCLKIQIGG